MPSLRKRVTSYFRQLSFHNEPREKRHNLNENSFITRYLQGLISLREGPPILYGKNPTDLPNFELGHYTIGCDSIVGCYTGPHGGLTTIKRTEKHLSVTDPDIDFIDTQDETATTRPDDGPTFLSSLDDALLPTEWNVKCDRVYGVSESLYDCNQVTKIKNGDPIADCFGIIARNDSAILALADGVNWGEKAAIAAKSAIHGCLHYLNKTIFSDTQPFEKLQTETTSATSNCPTITGHTPTSHRRSGNHQNVLDTKEVFVSLLRAFNCAHDLILENQGMLTTLTVALVLPLKSGGGGVAGAGGFDDGGGGGCAATYVCCVCNVGDTLAYVYSQKYGIRELTKGSHNINCNRDMRDALGALGPVDGIKPELNNLTLSITTLQKGDIVLIASDGLTDNFDPNVCKFTVNSVITEKAPRRPSNRDKPPVPPPTQTAPPPPQKPPREKNMRRSQTARGSTRGATDVRSSGRYADARRSSQTSMSAAKSDAPTSVQQSELDNPLIAQFIKENAVDASKPPLAAKPTPTTRTTKPITTQRSSHKKDHQHQSSSSQQQSKNHKNVAADAVAAAAAQQQQQQHHHHQSQTAAAGGESRVPAFLRSKTTLEMRGARLTIPRNEDGLPFVTPVQRYEINLLFMEDILKRGISGHDTPCTTAKKLCECLTSFAFNITAAKRRTLEDADLYFDNRNGVLVEVSQREKKMRRRRGLEKVQNLPGKLDHVSCVAYNVGFFSY